MPLRKIRDAADATTCLRAALASGEPRATWARRNGIDPRSLNAWRLNLERDTEAEVPLRLVELVPHEARASARYVVRCAGFAVEVDGAFEDTVLQRLLRVIASC